MPLSTTYLPFTDSHPDAVGGFSDPVREKELAVEIPPELLQIVPEQKRDALQKVLAHDPRPSYQHDPERVYGMAFAGMEVKFRVDGQQLTVTGIQPTD